MHLPTVQLQKELIKNEVENKALVAGLSGLNTYERMGFQRSEKKRHIGRNTEEIEVGIINIDNLGNFVLQVCQVVFMLDHLFVWFSSFIYVFLPGFLHVSSYFFESYFL